ncbi:MAG: biotin--[acetyl-CoA-carboxylase] ligase [Bacteroidota bacterium]
MFKKYNFKEVDSTNDIAKKLVEKNKNVMISAEFQTKGKGRNGKTWIGNKSQNIYVSFGIKTEVGESGDEITKYQMLGSLAVLKALKEIAPEVKFTLKYPNDIIAENTVLKGKISGVLCEHEFIGMVCFKTVIGIGINVDQEIFDVLAENTPVSLKLLKVEITKEILLKKLEENIEYYLKQSREGIIENWKNELDIIGKKVILKGSEGEWEIRQILSEGRLQAFKNEETRLVDNGDSIRYL